MYKIKRLDDKKISKYNVGIELEDGAYRFINREEVCFCLSKFNEGFTAYIHINDEGYMSGGMYTNDTDQNDTSHIGNYHIKKFIKEYYDCLDVLLVPFHTIDNIVAICYF